MKINITLPTVSSLKLSGAALRSMEAADRRAIADWTTLQAAAQAFSDNAEALMLDLTAANLRAAYEAETALITAHDAILRLAPRWRERPSLRRQWLTSGSAYETPREIVSQSTRRLEFQLEQAGIPIPPIDSTNLTQWLFDIQAMGVE